MPLEKLNLEENIIYECLVITTADNLQPNIAPMGIIFEKNNIIIIQPFIESDTFSNIMKKRIFTIHFTTDPYLFTISILFQEAFSSSDFKKIPNFDAFRLEKLEENFLIAELIEEVMKDKNRAKIKCKIIYTNFCPVVCQPFTRAFSLLVEILIDASRIVAFKDNKKHEEKIKALLERINHHSEIIHRVTNENSIYITLLEKILNRINSRYNSKKEY